MTLEAVAGGQNTPPEPDWAEIFTDDLDLAAAKEIWRGVINEMRDAGTLVVENGHAVRRLVLFRIEFDRAARNVAEQGKVIRAKRTKTPQINPEWTCMKQAAEAVADIEAELGLSPRRRNAAAKVSRAKKKATAADNYLKSVGT
jgi:P27 family predicted phage terminase small subunit